ncbi:hypothetical protein CDAR_569121 [Caerostris darwini]|uniref:Uncharacterized protein n=1 Tax=Caerostris darwini TaxID=1538125 RepID=A0AAV4Q9G7_9ARAC|nr:hypothetical protein CDAR_569121 [Caerostris darwini]
MCYMEISKKHRGLRPMFLGIMRFQGYLEEWIAMEIEFEESSKQRRFHAFVVKMIWTERVFYLAPTLLTEKGRKQIVRPRVQRKSICNPFCRGKLDYRAISG